MDTARWESFFSGRGVSLEGVTMVSCKQAGGRQLRVYTGSECPCSTGRCVLVQRSQDKAASLSGGRVPSGGHFSWTNT